MAEAWVAWEVGEGLAQLLRYLIRLDAKVLERLLGNATWLLHQRAQQVLDVEVGVLVRANDAIGLRKRGLRRGAEAIDVIPGLWLDIAGAYIAGVDWLEKGFEGSVWDAQCAAGFDSPQATVVDPVVDDLPRDLQARGNVVGRVIVDCHDSP
jgi:hypothetical protein